MEEVAVECPACASRRPHAVIKSNGQATVECSSCGHVHKVRVPRTREVERRVVVSQGEESFSTHVPMEAEQTVRVGDEFVLESDEGVFGVEVTALEVESDGDNRRVQSVEADDVETVWTRVVDNVAVPVTLHTAKGVSESHKMSVPGDYTIVVGEDEEVDGKRFEVTAFVHESGDRFRLEGDDVLAKNAKRVYGESG